VSLDQRGRLGLLADVLDAGHPEFEVVPGSSGALEGVPGEPQLMLELEVVGLPERFAEPDRERSLERDDVERRDGDGVLLPLVGERDGDLQGDQLLRGR
jgi:hypothetical protein